MVVDRLQNMRSVRSIVLFLQNVKHEIQKYCGGLIFPEKSRGKDKPPRLNEVAHTGQDSGSPTAAESARLPIQITYVVPNDWGGRKRTPSRKLGAFSKVHNGEMID